MRRQRLREARRPARLQTRTSETVGDGEELASQGAGPARPARYAVRHWPCRPTNRRNSLRQAQFHTTERVACRTRTAFCCDGATELPLLNPRTGARVGDG